MGWAMGQTGSSQLVVLDVSNVSEYCWRGWERLGLTETFETVDILSRRGNRIRRGPGAR